MRVYKYTDRWEGKNYGCYPKSTSGQDIKERLDQSHIWTLVSNVDHIDERNDNQVDINRGSDFVYVHKNGVKRINIYMERSRSGKTVEWKFVCNFDNQIDL